MANDDANPHGMERPKRNPNKQPTSYPQEMRSPQEARKDDRKRKPEEKIDPKRNPNKQPTSYPPTIQRAPQEDSRFREKDPKRPPSKDDERRGSKVPNSAPTGPNRIQISTMPKKDDLRNRPSVEKPVPGSAEKAKKSRGIGTFVDRQRAK